MKYISVICALLSLLSHCRAEENFIRAFKDCFFIESNFSSIQFIFGDSNVNPSRDNCSELIIVENFAKNVKLIKFVGIKSNLVHSNFGYDSMQYFENTFPEIRTLDISSNEIEYLDSVTLKFPNLEFLNLSHNKLNGIPTNLFNGAPNLTTIDLSFNKIKGVLWYYGHFQALTELKSVDLRNNNLEHIDSRLFTQNRKLEVLRLENNPISIDCNVFELLDRSVSISIAWNNAVELDTKCMEGLLKITVDNDEVVFRSTNTAKDLMRIKNYYLWPLRRVYFGWNQLANATDILDLLGPSVEILSLSGNSMGKLTTKTFERFEPLTALYLDRTKLAEFDVNPFAKLDKLTTLKIGNNGLTKLNVTSLKKTLMNLEVFSIAGNNIEGVSEVIENLSPKLRQLDVSTNFIGKLNESTFQRFHHLWSLSLAKTNLTQFDFNPFENLTELRHLDISNNDLRRLNATVLSPTLMNLTTFNAVDNNFENTQEIVSHLNESMMRLDLSGNYLRKIEESTFQKFYRLNGLILQRTNLTDFDVNALKHLKYLTGLDISYNNLTEVEFTALEPMEWLNTLIVKFNNLSELKGLDRTMYPRLKILHIEGNPIPCEYISKLKESWKKTDEEQITHDLKIVGDQMCEM